LRAELILFNGTIHTLDPLHPTAEAVSVASGRFLGVGALEAVEAASDASSRRIDLEGRTLIPGFNEASFPLWTGEASFEDAILAGAKGLLSHGITSITHAGLLPEHLAVYRALTESRRMPLRANAIARRYAPDGTKIPLPERFESNWLRIDTVELFADSDGDPRLRENDQRMQALVWDIHRGGLRASIRASSEGAIQQAIGAISYASARLASRMKHRLEHVAAPNTDQLNHCRGRIGMTVLPSIEGNMLSAIVAAGVTVALSGDAAPLATLQAVAARSGLTIADLIPLYTVSAAIMAGEDYLKGTISPGKYADFAILSGDPLRAPVDRLSDLSVEMTALNGQIVYAG